MKHRAVLFLVAALLLVGAGGGKTFTPPFKLGPSGGDRWNYVSADPGGDVTTIRAYPLPPQLTQCTGSAGWANLRAVHKTRVPQRSVSVSYTDALVDPYTFVTATAKIGNRYIGSKKIRGPITGDGTVTFPIAWPRGTAARTVVVDFGLELTSACPAVDGGHASFTKVVISPNRVKR